LLYRLNLSLVGDVYSISNFIFLKIYLFY
jgi:hypothetical protein